MRAVCLLVKTVTFDQLCDLRAMPFWPDVVLAASHPKNVGRVFNPRFTNVLISGIAGKALPFWMVAFRERRYVATRDAPFGQVSEIMSVSRAQN